MSREQTVGFVGVGAMGGPMARNLRRRDFELAIHDTAPGRVQALAGPGVTAVGSPREVAERAARVVTMLPSLDAIEAVALGSDGLVHGMQPGSVLIEMSTSRPPLSRKIAAALAERGFEMLDAPVSGTTPAAESGTLIGMVGGPAETLERCRPVLEAMCSQIHHCGGPGQGNAMKLAVNLLIYVPTLAAFESMALAVRAGLRPSTLVDILEHGPAGSPIMTYKLGKAIARDFEPGSNVDIAVKDLELAIEFARETHVPMMLPSLALQVFDHAKHIGLGPQDTSAVMTFYEQLLGFRLDEAERAQ